MLLLCAKLKPTDAVLFDKKMCGSGKGSSCGRSLSRFSTASAIEDPIIPNVDIKHTQLLINGQFVDAESGNHVLKEQLMHYYFSLCLVIC